MIIYRHIIREHILPFIYSLSIIIFLFVMQLAVELLQKILAKNLAIGIVIEIFLCHLAWMVALAVPMAVLAATLMAFGKMSADSEILAVKASGRNLFYLITPVFAAALLLTTMLIFFNNLIYPDANHRAATLMSDISRKKPAALIEPNILIRDFPHHALLVDQVNAKTGALTDVKIFSDVPGSDPATTVAKSGRVNATKDGDYIRLELFEGQTHSISRENPDEYFVGYFDRQVVYLRNVDSELHRTENAYRGDREKSARALLKDVEEYRRKKTRYLNEHTAELDSLIAASARLDSIAALAGADTAADSAAPADFAAWRAGLQDAHTRALTEVKRQERAVTRTAQRVHQEERKISQYLVEVHKKYSIPVACIVFVLIGAPLGIMAKRGGLAVGASYSIFFFIVYWAFLIGGENLADRLVITPATAMWSANVIIGACGVYLVIRMVRETTFLSFAPILQARHNLMIRVRKNPLSKAFGVVFGFVMKAPVWILNKMAGILPAYLVRLFLGYLVGVIVALVVIFVVVDYISNLRSFENARWSDIALYYWYYLHWFILVIAPIAILLASMFAVGRMAKYSELVALKAAGISIQRFAIPLLFIGLLLSGASFYFGEKRLPRANAARQDLREEIKQGRTGNAGRKAGGSFHRNFYYFGNSTTVYRFGEFRTRPQMARNVWRERFDQNRIVERIRADRMEHADGKWVFVNGQTRRFAGDTATVVAFDSMPDPLLAAPPEEMVTRLKGVEEMSYWELADAIEIARRRGEKVHTYLADLHFKIALPFMNFIVIILGLSITARAGRKGGAALFGIGLMVTFSYWILSQFSLAMGQNGRLDPMIAAWGGNALFLLIGLVLFRKASR